MFLDTGTLDRLRPLLNRLNGPEYADIIRTLMRSNLGFADDPARGERILQQMTATPLHVVPSMMWSVFTYDSPAAVKACQVPALYLHAQYGVPQQLASLRGLGKKVFTGQTVGAGHFLQLEAPDQVHAMLERFLRVAFT
ncbi:MAG: alpha/beta hydrolase [Dehalococcoidia bacterium]|nr:alpha/beta hydrolase [Dehalococcoidia bacterium]